jgi:hypothetical protein
MSTSTQQPIGLAIAEDSLTNLLLAVINLAQRDARSPCVRKQDDARQFLAWVEQELAPALADRQIPFYHGRGGVATSRWALHETTDSRRMLYQRLNATGQGTGSDKARGQSSRAR